MMNFLDYPIPFFPNVMCIAEAFVSVDNTIAFSEMASMNLEPC